MGADRADAAAVAREGSRRPRPVSDRLCLQGILYVLINDIAWQLLPLALGFGSRPNLLAAAGAVAEGRGLRPAAPDPALQTERGRRAGLVQSMRRRFPCPREKGGRRHRAVAGRPAEDGQQAPSDLRRTRNPAQGHHHRGQRQRRHPDPRPGRRHPARRRTPGPAPPTSPGPAR